MVSLLYNSQAAMLKKSSPMASHVFNFGLEQNNEKNKKVIDLLHYFQVKSFPFENSDMCINLPVTALKSNNP